MFSVVTKLKPITKCFKGSVRFFVFKKHYVITGVYTLGKELPKTAASSADNTLYMCVCV